MKGREDMDKKIGKMQGDRDQIRMGSGEGGVGASCNPMAAMMMRKKMGGKGGMDSDDDRKGGPGGPGGPGGERPEGPGGERPSRRLLEEDDDKEEWEGKNMDVIMKMKEKHSAFNGDDEFDGMREKMGQMKEKWDKTGKMEGGMGDFKDMFSKMKGGKGGPGGQQGGPGGKGGMGGKGKGDMG